jgi:hypothetical protein
VAYRAEKILRTRGCPQFHIYVASCKSRSGLRGWEYLEDALLALFRQYYYELPKCNDKGKSLRFDTKLRRLFKQESLEKLIMLFDSKGRL